MSKDNGWLEEKVAQKLGATLKFYSKGQGIWLYNKKQKFSFLNPFVDYLLAEDDVEKYSFLYELEKEVLLGMLYSKENVQKTPPSSPPKTLKFLNRPSGG